MTHKKHEKIFTLTNWIHLGLLLFFACMLLVLSIPKGHVFGSETDWLCQHVAFAEYMRTCFYDTKELFPDFTRLGGGENFYNLSYYGLLRPDVLLSYCLPGVSAAAVVQGYAVFEILLGAALLYFWLCRRKIQSLFCLVSGFLYLCANCFFQAHRQIIFVNYLPFLILALISIDRLLEKPPAFLLAPQPGLTFSFFMIILHSYYFFPACFAACTLYFCYRKKELGISGRSIWGRYLACAAAAGLLSMILLLPTALAILENKKDVKGSSVLEILSVNPALNSLLYSPYGCGLTVVCLYTLFLSIQRKRTRRFSVILFSLLFFQVFYWILNGTLYVRPKCLIPFTPLLLYLTAFTLEELANEKIHHSFPLALLCLVPVMISAFFTSKNLSAYILADGAVFICYAAAGCAYHKYRHHKYRAKRLPDALQNCHTLRSARGVSMPVRFISCLLLCILPACLFLATASTESFVPVQELTQSAFSKEDMEALCQASPVRVDDLSQPLNNANHIFSGTQNKSTLYSSVSNTLYNHLLFDILKMPVRIRNRVAMLSENHPFLEYLMGVRYIHTSSGKIPAGYKVLSEKDGQVLAENENVLPLAYGSTAWMTEEAFDALSYPENLDTLMNRTIIPEKETSSLNLKAAQSYLSQMEAYELPKDFMKRTGTSKARHVSQPLPTAVKDRILLLSFDISEPVSKDVYITINGIRNCLSGQTAPYPNHNTTFTYALSGNEPINKLEIDFSGGNYKISNVTAFTLPLSAFSHPGITPFSFGAASGKELLNGSITMEEDGYFVTSFAFSQGYSATIDNKKVTPVKVNKAFVGFPLTKGAHEIVVEFHAPGKAAGGFVSLFTLCCLIFVRVFQFRGRRVMRRASSAGSE